jgi:hypothetical protein
MTDDWSKQRLPDFIGARYQNGEKFTNRPQNVPDGRKTYQMLVKYSNKYQNIPTFSIPRRSKIYPNM